MICIICASIEICVVNVRRITTRVLNEEERFELVDTHYKLVGHNLSYNLMMAEYIRQFIFFLWFSMKMGLAKVT